MKKLLLQLLTFTTCPLILPAEQTTTKQKPHQTTQPIKKDNQPVKENEFYNELKDEDSLNKLIEQVQSLGETYKIHPEIAQKYKDLLIQAYHDGHTNALYATGRYFQHGLNTMADLLRRRPERSYIQQQNKK